ncbi:ankyrin-3-like [Mytilus californianus]|uniref:ankyrin-3-like n=1 Tax=Mytilus californianus TaxID=6549 RepID=UPI00224745D3|nr:ankyrin-3-like [Mytilus californianus]XP_052088612.1 ankyrin-3-like [Mytilus californianus]
MTNMSEEEENYVRMGLLLTGISPSAVRTLFDKQFHPPDLNSILEREYNKLLELKSKKKIKESHWSLLFPACDKNRIRESRNFDTTLMITLFRYLTSIEISTDGKLPSATDTTLGADIARIEYYRNYLSYLEDVKMNNAVFNDAWDDTCNAIYRLGGTLLHRECDFLKSKILDQTNQQIIVEMKQSINEIQEIRHKADKLQLAYDSLQTQTDSLHDEHESLKEIHGNLRKDYKTVSQDVLRLNKAFEDAVPWNRRVHMKNRIKAWKKGDEMHIETRADRHIFELIAKKSCVTVIASSGVGKTSAIRHIALLMAEKDYDILPVSDPYDIINFYNKNRKSLFVIDDICGTFSLDIEQLERWGLILTDIKSLLEEGNCKIIAACRLQIFNDAKFEEMSIFKLNGCNLMSDETMLTRKEKQDIAELYLKADASKICDLHDEFVFFPLLCRLYHDNASTNIVDFFKNPFQVYESELDRMFLNGNYTKYCALALCVMFNNRLPQFYFNSDVDKKIKHIFKNTFEECKLSRGTPILFVKDELDSLINTFVKKDETFYRILHDKLFDFLACYFGKRMIKCLITNADAYFIAKRFVFGVQDYKDEFIIEIPPNLYMRYQERLIDDWTNGRVTCVFCNKNMKSPDFRNMFLSYLRDLDLTLQKKLAHTYNTGYFATVLMNCCNTGDINFVNWCISQNTDVNECSKDGISPLSISCSNGSTEILRLLLALNADIDTSEQQYGTSGLFIACLNGHTEIVKILSDNNVDVNKCNKTGTTPLFMACQMGFTEIVQILIEQNIDIDKCREDGTSALFIACERGYVEIVKLLLDKNADINNYRSIDSQTVLYKSVIKGHVEIVELLVNKKADINTCLNDNTSLVLAACQHGCEKIIKILIDHQVDINKCNDAHISPLYLSCQNGFENIVKILIDHQADINKCINRNISPLYVSCENGYESIVNKLLASKSDVNICTQIGESPLLVASRMGHSRIVDILLNNKANVNKCMNTGSSPLFMACQEGKFEVVKLLLDNEANIHKQNNIGSSPFVVACAQGHTDIVYCLLKNNADIDQCMHDGTSPLFMASQEGHFDIVKLLLEKRVNLHKCRDDGQSPLFIACQHGNAEIVNILLDKRADVNKCQSNGDSPLYTACKFCQEDIVVSLLQHNADINLPNKIGGSPLFIACQKGYIGVVTILLLYNADTEVYTNVGASPLLIASSKGHTNIVKMLLEVKADTNKCAGEGISPLFIACKEGHEDTVKLLAESNADINMASQYGMTPLYLSCQNGDLNIVKLLLNKHANVNIATFNGSTPLFASSREGHLEVVEELLKKGAEMNSNIYGISPLEIALYKGHSDVLHLLEKHVIIIHNQDINKITNTGYFPLYLACGNDDIESVQMLLNKKADVNLCTCDGTTALHAACYNGNIEIVEELLRKGADLKDNNDGISPLDIVRGKGYNDILHLISRYITILYERMV